MSETLELTLEKAKSLVDEVIKEKGSDFVYKRLPGEDCKYVHEGFTWDVDVEDYVSDEGTYEPGCIVGYALHKAGIPLVMLEKNEGASASYALDRLEQDGLLTCTPEASRFLEGVQDLQDSGRTWGTARDETLRKMGEK